MMQKMTFVVWFALAAVACNRAYGDDGHVVTKDGVSVWVAETEFSDKTFFEKKWEVVTEERLPLSLQGHPVIGTDDMLCAIESGGTQLAVYTRQKDNLVRRASVRLQPIAPRSQYRLVRNASRDGLGIEVRHNDRVQYTLCVFGSGLIELKPKAEQQMIITKSQLAYAIVPSMIGADLVYDPRRYVDRERLYVPSANLLVGLVDGGGCVMVGAWEPGDQLVQLGLAKANGQKVVDGLSMNLAGKSFYLQFVQQPAIWHVESLKPAYLARDTVIGWQRPFEAKWIGRFYIRSQDIHYPFYFVYTKRNLWGRWVRGGFAYPLWFDKDKTFIHCEKKLPPQGELLIYCLDSQKRNEKIPTPIRIMREALGDKQVAKLLDFEGIEHRPLLAHGYAVCAMLRQMNRIFEAREEVKKKKFIAKRADEVATFIEMIRQRVFEYRDFAQQMEKLLQEREQVLPAKTLKALKEIVEEITLVTEDLPDVSLGEVRRWTDQIKSLAGGVKPSNRQVYRKLAEKCRSVAGSQDELARELCILTIRLMEKTAASGTDSPEQVRLVEEILARSRKILRHPTWWEAGRYENPSNAPG